MLPWGLGVALLRMKGGKGWIRFAKRACAEGGEGAKKNSDKEETNEQTEGSLLRMYKILPVLLRRYGQLAPPRC